MAMENPPNGKGFWLLSFATQITRGLLRDSSARRKTMFAILGLAVFMLVAGSTFLRETLDHRVHAAWFIIFWLACGWLTATALLLALFDLLILRAQGRAARKAFREKFSESARDPGNQREG